MSKMTMPEPVYAKYRIGRPNWIDQEEWRHSSVIAVNGYIRHIEKVNNFGKPGYQGYGEEIQVEWLITTTQAEAYASAKVREALEAAAKVCDSKYESRAEGGFPREASTARALANEIRALIPPTE